MAKVKVKVSQKLKGKKKKALPSEEIDKKIAEMLKQQGEYLKEIDKKRQSQQEINDLERKIREQWESERKQSLKEIEDSQNQSDKKIMIDGKTVSLKDFGEEFNKKMVQNHLEEQKKKKSETTLVVENNTKRSKAKNVAKKAKEVVQELKKAGKTVEELKIEAEKKKNERLKAEALRLEKKVKKIEDTFGYWDDENKDYFIANEKLLDDISKFYDSLNNRNFNKEIEDIKEYAFSLSKQINNQTYDNASIPNKNSVEVLKEDKPNIETFVYNFENFEKFNEQTVVEGYDIYLNNGFEDEPIEEEPIDMLFNAIEEWCSEKKIDRYLYLDYNKKIKNNVIKNISISYLDISVPKSPALCYFKFDTIELESPDYLLNANKTNTVDKILTPVKKIFYEVFDKKVSPAVADKGVNINKLLPEIENIKSKIDAAAITIALNELIKKYPYIPESLLDTFIKVFIKIESIQRDSKKYENLKSRTNYTPKKKNSAKNKTKQNAEIVEEYHKKNSALYKKFYDIYEYLSNFEERYKSILKEDLDIKTLQELKLNIEVAKEKQLNSKEDDKYDFVKFKKISKKTPQTIKEKVLIRTETIINGVKKLLNDKANNKIRPLILEHKKQIYSESSKFQKELWGKINSLVEKQGITPPKLKTANFTNYPMEVPEIKVDNLLKNINLPKVYPNPELVKDVPKSLPFMNGNGGYKEDKLIYAPPILPSDIDNLIKILNEPKTITTFSDDGKIKSVKIPKGTSYRSNHFTVNIFVKKSDGASNQIAMLQLPDISYLDVKFSKSPKGMPKGYKLPNETGDINNNREKKATENMIIKSYYGCLMAATYFQILVSNTPLDEDYEVYSSYFKVNRKVRHKNKNGLYKSANQLAEEMVSGGTKVISLKEHKKDNEILRADWVLQFRGKNFKAYQSETPKGRRVKKLKIDSYFTEELFSKRNDSEAIEKMAIKLFKETALKSAKRLDYDNYFNAVNIDEEKFNLVEYGGYRQVDADGKLIAASSPMKHGDKFDHGLEDGFTYQAPRGMKRLTDAVISNITNNMGYEGYAKKILEVIKNLDIDLRLYKSDETTGENKDFNYYTGSSSTDFIIRER